MTTEPGADVAWIDRIANAVQAAIQTTLDNCDGEISGADQFDDDVRVELSELSDLSQPALDLDAPREAVIGDVLTERSRQNDKWGVQRHSWVEWMAILGEEFGEVWEAVDLHWGRSEDIQALRKELVQLAAVSVQIIEHIDEWGKR